MKKIMTLIMLSLLTLNGALIAGDISSLTILKTVDSIRKLDQDVTAKVSILVQDKQQGTKSLESVYFAKDSND